MDTLDKKSFEYQNRDFREFFDAAESSTVVGEDYVCYSYSLQRLRSYERGLEYARETSYAEGKAKGKAEG